MMGERRLGQEALFYGFSLERHVPEIDDAAFGGAPEVTPKFIAPSDPATRWTAAHCGPAFFAYSANCLIDVDNAIIVDVEATTASVRRKPWQRDAWSSARWNASICIPNA